MGNTSTKSHHCEDCGDMDSYRTLDPDQCLNEDGTPYLEVRFYLIGVFGFGLCAAGIVFNIILLKILLHRSLRTTYLIYLFVMAIIDINIVITYIVVMSLATWYEYFSNYFLYFIWHTCLPYFFTLSRIVTLVSTYLLVACTAERYLEVVQLYAPGKYIQITQRKRYVVISTVLLASVAFRVVVFWELDVVVADPACEGTLSYFSLNRTHLVSDFHYSIVYSFYVLHMVQVFFPFLALLTLNILIVRKWRTVLRRDSMMWQKLGGISNDGSPRNFGQISTDGSPRNFGQISNNGSARNFGQIGTDGSPRNFGQICTDGLHRNFSQVSTGQRNCSRATVVSITGDQVIRQIENSEMRKRIKYAHSARVMMIAIVTSYLVCNLLNLVITFLEHLDKDILRAYSDFYSFAADAVTLLTAVNASMRLPIYYRCNLKIRSEVVKFCRNYSMRRTKKGGPRKRNVIELAAKMNALGCDGDGKESQTSEGNSLFR